MAPKQKRPQPFIINDTPCSLAFTSQNNGKCVHLFVPTVPVSQPAYSEDMPPVFDLALESSYNFDDPNTAASSLCDENSPQQLGNVVVQLKARVRNVNLVGSVVSGKHLPLKLVQDLPQVTWKESFRDAYLNASLCLHGRGQLWTCCSFCSQADPTYRCLDCNGFQPTCKACCLERHCFDPLHRLQVHHWAIEHAELDIIV